MPLCVCVCVCVCVSLSLSLSLSLSPSLPLLSLTTKEQVDRSSYPEVQTILKAKQHSKCRLEHPRYNKADSYYLLTRREQVTVLRFRTCHYRLNYHLATTASTITCIPNSASAILSSALVVLAVSQQYIYCSPASSKRLRTLTCDKLDPKRTILPGSLISSSSSTSHSERESGQTTLP